MIRSIRTVNVRFTSRTLFLMARNAFVATLAIGVSVEPVLAGSPTGELEYNYPCMIDHRPVKVRYDYLEDRATVGIRWRNPRSIEIVANEKEAFRQPVEVVMFEYFSACQQARKLMEQDSHSPDQLNDAQFMRSIIFGADCDSLSHMRREGLLRDWEGFQTILENLSYERATQRYFGLPFASRAKNIQDACPF